MKKRSLFCRVLMLCLMVCLLALPHAAYAYGSVDMNAPVRLTLSAAYDGASLSGVQLRLYRVAGVSREGVYTPVAPFDACGVDFNKLEGSQWDAVLDRLAELSAGAAPAAEVQTDASGIVSLVNLPKGLYLALAETLTAGDWVYRASPMVVALPGHGADGISWEYTVEAAMKLERQPALMNLRIVKLWKDGGDTSHRPEYIQAELYCDGQLSATVELSHANSWQYTFENLERTHTWKVTERKVPEGYTVSYSRENDALVITNTFGTPPTQPPKIPQTGLLWWPVPLLAGMGVAIFLVGWAIHRKWRHDHEGA